MEYILHNPLNQIVSIFNFVIVDQITNEGIYTKEEKKAFVFQDVKRIVNNDSVEYIERTIFLTKEKIKKDSKVLPEKTLVENVDDVDAQTIVSVIPIIDHDGLIEGYEVTLG